MVDIKTFRMMALAFDTVVELSHFHLQSFRVNKKIFATLDEKNNRAMVKLSPIDQAAFCAFDKSIIYPVPGGWGAQGATYIELSRVRKTTLRDALTTAYRNVSLKPIVRRGK